MQFFLERIFKRIGLPTIRQTFELGVISLGCFVIFWIVLYGTKTYLGVHYLVALCIAEVVYIAVKLWPVQWIFPNRDKTDIWQQGWNFVKAECVVFVLNVGLLHVLVEDCHYLYWQGQLLLIAPLAYLSAVLLNGVFAPAILAKVPSS